MSCIYDTHEKKRQSIESALQQLGVSLNIEQSRWIQDAPGPDWIKIDMQLREQRDIFTKQFSWAIPNQEALSRISNFSPLIEIGAGTGFWAKLLRGLGVDILTFDKYPPDKKHNNFHDKIVYTNIQPGSPRTLRGYRDRTLFLCWPPYNNDMAYRCLQYYKGEYLIYIGEDNGGCNGDTDFHNQIEKDWNEIDKVYIPQWPGLHDSLLIYKRN